MEDPAAVVVTPPVDGTTDPAAPVPVSKPSGRRRKSADHAPDGTPSGGHKSASGGSQETRREPRVVVPTELLPGAIEAVLMAAERTLPAGRLAMILGLCSDETAPKDVAATIEGAIAALNQQYEASGRSFRIEPLSGGYRMMSLPQFAPYLAELHRTRSIGRMTRAAVETLAIIAYKQPMTRAQLEAIRGVSCGEVLRSLTERRLITIKGRAEELGRPLLYGTTKQFLDAFGLASIKDLPTMAEFKFNVGESDGVTTTPEASIESAAPSGQELEAAQPDTEVTR